VTTRAIGWEHLIDLATALGIEMLEVSAMATAR
jgi:hypothetical protein